jgi:putative aldouronate transport system substrate-binding protein
MEKDKIYRATSVLLAIAMLAVLPSCSQNTKASSNSSSKAVVQIDVFSASTSSTASGVYDKTWWGKAIKNDIGVSLNVLPSGTQASQKLQAYMASGELPDIVIFQKSSDVQSAIRGKMLVNLDEHISSLPNVTKNASTALKYCRDNISNGTGKAYTITSNIGAADLSATEPSWGPYLRWDLYTKIGSPKISTWDDYLTALQKMQKLMPTTADGSKTYGITLWKDWDNYSMFLATELGPTVGIDCGDQLGSLPFLQVNFNTGETKNTLDSDSQYIQALKFYYKANQMGLVDPDSLTQTYATAKAKVTDGKVLFSWWSWLNSAYNTVAHTNATTPTGFEAVLPSNTKSFVNKPQ